MKPTLRVVAIVGSSSDPDQLFRSAFGDESLEDVLAEASGRAVHVDLVTWSPSSTRPFDLHIGSGEEQPVFDRILARVGAIRLNAFLRRYAAGRLLSSLSPMDQSRVFWRTVRRNPKAMAKLKSADVLLAVDLPAVRVAWEMRRSDAELEAYYGLASISKVFASRFAQSNSS